MYAYFKRNFCRKLTNNHVLTAYFKKIYRNCKNSLRKPHEIWHTSHIGKHANTRVHANTQRTQTHLHRHNSYKISKFLQNLIFVHCFYGIFEIDWNVNQYFIHSIKNMHKATNTIWNQHKLTSIQQQRTEFIHSPDLLKKEKRKSRL